MKFAPNLPDEIDALVKAFTDPDTGLGASISEAIGKLTDPDTGLAAQFASAFAATQVSLSAYQDWLKHHPITVATVVTPPSTPSGPTTGGPGDQGDPNDPTNPNSPFYTNPLYDSAGGMVYASSGYGPWIPRGTDTVPAMLTPGERVLSVQDTQSYDGGSNSRREDQYTIIVQLDNAEILRQVFNGLPAELTLRGR